MRLFLDECVDWQFSRELSGHDVATAHQMGWTGTRDGELLARAAKQFDAFVTTDQNLSFQQNLRGYDISAVVLRARSNRISDLRPLAPRVLQLLSSLKRGEVLIITD